MSILITLLIAGLIFSLLWWLVSILPLPPVPPASYLRTVLYVVLIIAAVLYLLRFLPR